MALLTQVGSIASPAGTGNQATTGVGFQPKAIIFYGNILTADGSSGSNIQQGFGIAVSSSSRAAVAINNTSSWGGRHDNTKCLLQLQTDNTVLIAGDLVSMDADGFTINWTTVSTGIVVNYLALGGDDLSNVFLKQFQAPAGTGNQSQTGVGFQPDSMFLFSLAYATAPASTNTNHNELGIGFTSGTGGQGTLTSDWNGASAETYQQTSACISVIDSGAKALEANLVSFDADGFTLNFTTTLNNAYVWALCLKGGRYKVGTYNKPTGTGNSAVTGVGFTPVGVIQASSNATADTNISTASGGATSFGGVSSVSSRGAIWAKHSGTDLNLDRTKMIKTLSDSATVTGAADLVSFDSDGFTQNWSTADANAYQIIYLAFGSNPVPTISQHFYLKQGFQ